MNPRGANKKLILIDHRHRNRTGHPDDGSGRYLKVKKAENTLDYTIGDFISKTQAELAIMAGIHVTIVEK